MSEILGALFKNLAALIGVAAVALILYAVFGSSKTGNAINDLNQFQTSAQSLYSTQSTFTSLTNAVAISGGLAPTRMIAGGTLVNPWSGAITVNVNAGDATRFDVTEAGVPSDACAKMATNTPSIVGLKVNGTAQALPIDAGAAVTACNASPNTLIFTFSH
ncbi:type 4 pilus major pilin [Cupriavidus necator]|uniref:type 4 pilus major pilin n=1 Tax=Cupriavidus necator TaxID=106590 RepID=UPI003ECD436F